MRKNISATLVQYLLRVLLLELGLVILVGAILYFRERSLHLFGDWMFWAGLVVLIIGALNLFGGWGITRSGTYQVGMTVGEQDISTRTRTDMKEEQASFSFLQLSMGVAILAIIIGSLV